MDSKSKSDQPQPPEDAGKPLFFPTAQNVDMVAPAATNNDKTSKSKKDGKNSRTRSEQQQVPMEFMHLQRSQSIRARSRDSPGGSGAAGSGAGPGGSGRGGSSSSSQAAAAAVDMGKRRSSRAIKRKRFDDEIVDSSPGIASSPSTAAATAASSASTSASTASQSMPAPPSAASAASAAAQPPPKPVSKPPSPMPQASSRNPMTMPGIQQGSSKPEPAKPAASGSNAAASKLTGNKGKGMGKIPPKGLRGQNEWDPSLANSRAALKKKANKKKTRAKREGAWKDLSRWKPTDDLALITAVMQTHDLPSVFRGVKFSCHFTLTEVQERWYALMYEPIISKMAVQAIKNLHPEVILATQRKTLFSKQEQEAVSTIKSSTNPPPTLKDFSELLARNPTVFHHARTPRCLAHYWQSLKQYTLLPDQSVQPLPRDNHILNFLDAEAAINDGELAEERDVMTEHELAASDRKTKKEIRHLEAEVSKWQVLVDRVRGDGPPDFDNQTLAVLRGRLVRYLMRSKEITIGRSTADHAVDVDLKLEGPAWKISRKQGVIKLNTSGEFFIANEGKRAMFIDGRPVSRGHRSKLCNNSVLEIAGLKFVFLINTDFIEAIRQEAMKLYQNS